MKDNQYKFKDEDVEIEFIGAFSETAIKAGHPFFVAYIGWSIAKAFWGEEAIISKRQMREEALLPMGMGECLAHRGVKWMQEFGFAENRGHNIKLRDTQSVAINMIGRTGNIPKTATKLPIMALIIGSNGVKSWAQIKALLTVDLRKRCGYGNISLKRMGSAVGKSKNTMRRYSRLSGDTAHANYEIVGTCKDRLEAVEKIKVLNRGRAIGQYSFKYSKKKDLWTIRKRMPNRYTNDIVKTAGIARREDIREINDLAYILREDFTKPVARKVAKKMKRTRRISKIL